ncbi:hypothetical protein ISF_02852 [Cordyceps fumosorosea ARSEF 2679]|uniref:Uncharacterized protein n=1 Tax=Cordyceps fumosorosea (strain ARSEF 2679) TaxID=1081104 RepID=A0A162JIP1_CORFA|nr:hypothetical protein ISF_02852 [Cordyceps fumosorosea ARSEF 2679]OAA69582.1 hypothetical protein ISF_02852 [Cordyceps fumosorosea ARSEF 2679]
MPSKSPSTDLSHLPTTTTTTTTTMETLLPPSATETRHLPHNRAANKTAPGDPWQSRRHEVRAVAKKLAAADDPFTCRRMGFACALTGGLDPDAASPCPALAGRHASARAHHFETQLPPLTSRPLAVTVTATAGARRTYKRDRYTPTDLDDDVALAKSAVRMPCDDNSHNTIAAAATAAASPRSVQTESEDAVAERAQVAALYEAGLLYRDAGAGRRLTLDSISHEEPTYAIRTAKPRRRMHGRPGGLELSFSDMGDEESLVQYVMALTASEADAADASSTLSSPTLQAIQEMDDASLESWVVLDKDGAARITLDGSSSRL